MPIARLVVRLLVLAALLMPAEAAAVCDGGDGACPGPGDGPAAAELGTGAADGRPAADPLADSRLQGGGLSCRAAPGGGAAEGPFGAAVALLLTLALLRRRRAGLGAVLLALGLLGGAAPARAQRQALDAIHFRPTGMPFGVLNVEGAATLPHLGASAGTIFSYGNAPLPLVSRTSGLEQAALRGGVQSQTLMTVSIALGLFDWAAASLDVPVMLYQDLGDRPVQRLLRGGDPLRDPVSAGIGDMRLSAKARLYGGGEGLGLALMALLSVPTGDGGSYLGWDSVSFEGRLIIDRRFASGLLVAANLSYLVHGETQLLNLRSQHELRYGAGLFWPLLPERLAALVEIFGRIGFSGEDGGVAVTAENVPVEALVGLSYRLPVGVTLGAGAALGLSHGYGAPSSRVYASVGYTPAFSPAVRRPEVPVTLEAPAAPALPASPAAPAASAAPVAPAAPAAPVLPAPPAAPAAPVSPSPPAAPPVVSPPIAGAAAGGEPVLRLGWRLVLGEPVAFAAGADRFTGSEVGLQVLARYLFGHPEIRLIMIEGHVDERGLSAEGAASLSRARAEVVRRRLVDLGVGRDRVRAEGFGAARPLELGEDARVRERNTRIDFIVLQ